MTFSSSIFSSLRSRIFLTSALLAVLSIAVAIYLVNVRVTREAESALQREIVTTGELVDQLRTTRTQTLTTMARLIADTSKLKAAVDTDDPPTVQEVADDYQQQLESNLLLVTNKSGGVLATVGASPRAAFVVANQPAIGGARVGQEGVSLLAQPDGILQLVTVPIVLGREVPEILGTLSAGFLLDDAFASHLKTVTGSDIALGLDGRILAMTLPRQHSATLADLLHRSDRARDVRIGTEDYVVLARPLARRDQAGGAAGAVALILRSRTEHLRFLETLQAGLGATAIVAVVLATLLSFAVARTITRPLAAITDVMREVTATGDLTRKIALRHSHRWDDEDARLLARTFNTLTDSIARFQREVSQKERLSSLGRLSMVIAHEIRNPLMIIKASLHVLRQPEVNASTLHEAVADIGEEVVRLNRIVNEVLDFARPIRFELMPTDVNVLCRESAIASQAAGPGAPVRLDLDDSLPSVPTDPERLRLALVNILVNARHAVRGVADPSDEPLVSLATHASGDRTTIVIADRGVGIDPTDLPRVFDPYFTTRRGGTGLGLAIAKNIVEGLGGTIGVASTVGRGTDIRIEFPAH